LPVRTGRNTASPALAKVDTAAYEGVT
jgi:hypothetical protein